MILLDLINLRKIRRAILYFFTMIVTLWLQFSVFSLFLLPGGVKPFFPAVVIVAIGMWEGGVWGAVAGLLTGIYCDLNLSDSTVLCLISFAAFGFFSGVLSDYLINRRLPGYLLLTAAALALLALFQILPHWVLHGASPAALIPVALLQTLWSLPFAVPAFFLVRLIARSGQ